MNDYLWNKIVCECGLIKDIMNKGILIVDLGYIIEFYFMVI